MLSVNELSKKQLDRSSKSAVVKYKQQIGALTNNQEVIIDRLWRLYDQTLQLQVTAIEMKDKVIEDSGDLGKQLQELGIDKDEELTKIANTITETTKQLQDIEKEIKETISCTERCQTEDNPFDNTCSGCYGYAPTEDITEDCTNCYGYTAPYKCSGCDAGDSSGDCVQTCEEAAPISECTSCDSYAPEVCDDKPEECDDSEPEPEPEPAPAPCDYLVCVDTTCTGCDEGDSTYVCTGTNTTCIKNDCEQNKKTCDTMDSEDYCTSDNDGTTRCYYHNSSGDCIFENVTGNCDTRNITGSCSLTDTDCLQQNSSGSCYDENSYGSCIHVNTNGNCIYDNTNGDCYEHNENGDCFAANDNGTRFDEKTCIMLNSKDEVCTLTNAKDTLCVRRNTEGTNCMSVNTKGDCMVDNFEGDCTAENNDCESDNSEGTCSMQNKNGTCQTLNSPGTLCNKTNEEGTNCSSINDFGDCTTNNRNGNCENKNETGNCHADNDNGTCSSQTCTECQLDQGCDGDNTAKEQSDCVTEQTDCPRCYTTEFKTCELCVDANYNPETGQGDGYCDAAYTACLPQYANCVDSSQCGADFDTASGHSDLCMTQQTWPVEPTCPDTCTQTCTDVCDWTQSCGRCQVGQGLCAQSCQGCQGSCDTCQHGTDGGCGVANCGGMNCTGCYSDCGACDSGDTCTGCDSDCHNCGSGQGCGSSNCGSGQADCGDCHNCGSSQCGSSNCGSDQCSYSPSTCTGCNPGSQGNVCDRTYHSCSPCDNGDCGGSQCGSGQCGNDNCGSGQ